MSTLLLVDDDKEICSLLSELFRKHGHSVVAAEDAQGMFDALERNSIDLIILDVMLGDEDGFSLCRRLRTHSSLPVIMLTAMSDHTDRVVGLEMGADDYLTKPFNQRELLARVKAVLRRVAGTASAALVTQSETRPMLYFSDWSLDVTRRELRSSADSLVMLSGGEFELLLAFAEHPRRILTREQLIDLAHGSAHDVYDRSIDVLVSRLRYKLEQDPKNPVLIRTVRNAGYMFAAEVTRLSGSREPMPLRRRRAANLPLSND